MDLWEETRRSVTGCWRLLMRDEGGYDDLNLSINGFWWSFAVLLPIAPFTIYFSQIVDQLGKSPNQTPISAQLIGLALVLHWFGWPLIMAAVARIAGLTRNFVRYVVAYNWASLLVVAFELPPVLLMWQGEATAGLGVAIYYLVFAVLIYYHWYIAKTALDTSFHVAWAVTLGDLLLNIALYEFITSSLFVADAGQV